MKPFREFTALFILGSLAIVAPGWADATSDTGFLDQPLPLEVNAMVQPIPTPDPNKPTVQVQSPMIKVVSLHGAVDLLSKISGKKVILDPELQTWPGADTENVWGLAMGVDKDAKTRPVFEQVCLFANLDWSYDAVSGTFFVKPRWKRNSSRSTMVLAQVVERTTPMRGGYSKVLDTWRVAFDSLLSKPENYPTAGTLRLYHDTHGHFNLCPFPVQNDFAGVVEDDQGHSELLVLNEQVSISNKDSAGDLAYYLFDQNGRYVRGGIYAVADGAQSGIVKVVMENNQITMDVGYGSFKMNPDHLHLGLVKGDIVLLGSTDRTGKERNADETRNSLCQFSHMMQLKFSNAGK